MAEPRAEDRDPLPPGQRLVERPPVLHVGAVPALDRASWSLWVEGEVEHPLRLAWRDLAALPQVEVVADLHGATGWTCRRLRWGGVPLRALIEACEPRPSARFVVARDLEEYAASLPLEVALREDTLLVSSLDGEALPPERGAPLRLVVPSRYAWKSVKWLRRLEFVAQDEPGFWESRGAHPAADPWRGERWA